MAKGRKITTDPTEENSAIAKLLHVFNLTHCHIEKKTIVSLHEPDVNIIVLKKIVLA